MLKWLSPLVEMSLCSLYRHPLSLVSRAKQQVILDAEALSLAVYVAQAQVYVGADALHGLDGQGATQILGVRPGGGQPEAKPDGYTEFLIH